VSIMSRFVSKTDLKSTEGLGVLFGPPGWAGPPRLAHYGWERR
jgi:hypothetical protein